MGEGTFSQTLEWLSSLLWGPVMIGYFVICGIYLSCRLRFVQFFNLKRAFVVSFTTSEKDRLSPGKVTKFQALMTSLGASVGTGNIVGVSTAVSYGGPGALFWMWISAFLGMAIKYTEGVLGFIYRQQVPDGKGGMMMTGGPMYYIKDGLHKRFGRDFSLLAAAFCFIMVCDSLIGPCMVQANAIAANLNYVTGFSKFSIGVVVTFLTLIVILGGGSRIVKISEYLVPVMGFVYLGGCMYVLLFHMDKFFFMIQSIFTEAFSYRAVSAGITGFGMGQAMRYGFARGLYSNEAGLGTSAVVAATAEGEHPVEQGFLAIVSTCVDTLFVCTMTGFAVLISGAWLTGGHESNLFAQRAFGSAMGEGVGMILVSTSLFLFAYTSAIAWCFFGDRFVLYLWGHKALLPYRLIYGSCMFVGSLLYIDVVWYLSDIFGAIAIIPNLFVLLIFSGEVMKSTRSFDQKVG